MTTDDRGNDTGHEVPRESDAPETTSVKKPLTSAARPGATPESTPPGGTPAFSDLTATDALLDRLGAGTLGDDDLDDPAVTVLAELLAVVDDPGEVDGDVARLMDVLGTRPLYLVGPDEAASRTFDEQSTGEEALISLGPVEPRVIDLTARTAEPAGDGAPEPGTVVGEPAAEGELASSSIMVRSKAQQRWGRGLSALQQASLPAASVLILLVLGGGVSAVVTGDPMAPVNGVTRVVSQLPGVSKPVEPARSGVNQAVNELNLAAQAARSNDSAGIARHLANARKAIAALPDGEKARLTGIATQIETGTPPAGPTTGDPGAGNPVASPTLPSGGGGVPVTTPENPPATDNPPVTTPESPPVTTPETTPPTTTPETSAPAPSDSPSTEVQAESSPTST